MRGLTILIAGRDPDRLRSALGLAATQAALGGRARLFLDGIAVTLLATPLAEPRDPVLRAAGLPTLAELVNTALALGVAIILCQSGLALAGLADIDERFETGGMAGIMATLDDDRLLAF